MDVRYLLSTRIRILFNEDGITKTKINNKNTKEWGLDIHTYRPTRA